MMRAMYVVGMEKDSTRIIDLKKIVHAILPDHKVFQYRFMHCENVEQLVKKKGCSGNSCVFTDCLHQIRGGVTIPQTT